MQENEKNRIGRPPGDASAMVRMWCSNIEAVDAWIAKRAPHLTRSQAFDYLFSIAFRHLSRRSLKPEKPKED